jgi:hypothetical protein
MEFEGHAGKRSTASLCMTRVARFFLVQHTKTGKIDQKYHKIYQMAISQKIDKDLTFFAQLTTSFCKN